jgi:hypothetical protein
VRPLPAASVLALANFLCNDGAITDTEKGFLVFLRFFTAGVFT